MLKFEHVEDGTQANHTDFLCKVPTFLLIIILIRVLVWREENDAMKEWARRMVSNFHFQDFHFQDGPREKF